MENIFCDKCHKLAAQKRVTDERLELLQNGRTIISLSTNPGQDGNRPWWKFWQKSVAERKPSRIGVRCPDRHTTMVEL